MDALNTPILVCHICGHPVPLTSSTIDENGNAVHEECYAKELRIRWERSLIFTAKDKDEDDPMVSIAFVNQFIPFML